MANFARSFSTGFDLGLKLGEMRKQRELEKELEKVGPDADVVRGLGFQVTSPEGKTVTGVSDPTVDRAAVEEAYRRAGYGVKWMDTPHYAARTGRGLELGAYGSPAEALQTAVDHNYSQAQQRAAIYERFGRPDVAENIRRAIAADRRNAELMGMKQEELELLKRKAGREEQLFPLQLQAMGLTVDAEKFENEQRMLESEAKKALGGGLQGMLNFYNESVKDGFKAYFAKHPDGSISIYRKPEGGGEPVLYKTYAPLPSVGLSAEDVAAYDLYAKAVDPKGLQWITNLYLQNRQLQLTERELANRNREQRTFSTVGATKTGLPVVFESRGGNFYVFEKGGLRLWNQDDGLIGKGGEKANVFSPSEAQKYYEIIGEIEGDLRNQYQNFDEWSPSQKRSAINERLIELNLPPLPTSNIPNYEAAIEGMRFGDSSGRSVSGKIRMGVPGGLQIPAR